MLCCRTDATFPLGKVVNKCYIHGNMKTTDRQNQPGNRSDEPAKSRDEQRAQALRDNLRRRKQPQPEQR